MKKYFLTSVVLLAGIILPAFAEDTQTTDKIITGGANTCTVDVLGVYDNNATAKTIATWTPVTYECAPGQYLLETETSVECTPCPIGSYCPGGTYTVESETNGATACPTDYTSDAGAVGENECYMGCELACSKNVECPAHSNNCTHSEFKTTGKQFSGETCNAYPSVCPIADFQCDMGYSKGTISLKNKNVLDASGVIICSLNNTDETDGMHMVGNSFLLDNWVNDCEFVEPGQIALIAQDGAVVLQMVTNEYNPDTVPGVKSVTYPESPGCDHENCTTITVKYLENANFTYGTDGDYVWGTIKYVAFPNMGKAEILNNALNEYYSSGSLSSKTLAILQQNLSDKAMVVLQNLLQNANTVTTDQLQQAFYAVLFSTMDKVEAGIPWLTSKTLFNETIKELLYASVIGWLFVRLEEFVPNATVSACVANTINIDWNPDNDGAHIQNMCYYDGAITLPADPVKPGYTFTGWKLLENTTTE